MAACMKFFGILTFQLCAKVSYLLLRCCINIFARPLLRSSISACNAGCFSVSGTGDGFFSSAFQSQLHGNPLYNVSMPRRKTWFHYVNLTIFSFDYHLLCHQNVCNAQQTDIWTEFAAICQVNLVSCLCLRPEGDCCKIVAAGLHSCHWRKVSLIGPNVSWYTLIPQDTDFTILC